jgi:hypothetical protein
VTGRRRSTLAVALVTLLMGSGCAQIPTSGPVERGSEVQGTDDEPSVRVLPRGPVAGQSATAVVRGFLDASASFESDHGVARRFLTSRASDAWDPGAGVTVIDDNPSRQVAADGRQVQLRAEQTAEITADGTFFPRGGVPITRDFPMKKVDGEWRIARAPQGLILDRIEASLSFRSFDLFFVNGAQTFLVPDPVYLPVEPAGSATSLVKALLSGPTRWLQPAAQSMIPAGTELVVDSVPVENGVAQVDLSAEFLDAAPETLPLAAAQITDTLLELTSSVSGVSISVEGSPLQLPNEPSVYTADTWDRFETDALSPALGLLLVRQGRVLQLAAGGTTSEQPRPLPGALGSGRLQVTDPSQSWDGQTVTALNERGTQLLVSEQSTVDRLRGDQLLPATLDGDGRLWVADVGRTSPRLRYRSGDRWRTVTLDAPRGVITCLRVSPDGTRMALVVRRGGGERAGGQLLVGRVVQGPERLRVEAFRRIELTLADVRAASWVDASTLAVVATSGRAPQPMLVDIDRTVTPLSTDVLVSLSSVVGAPGLPLVADTPRDGLWAFDGASWRVLTSGRDPAYPG